MAGLVPSIVAVSGLRGHQGSPGVSTSSLDTGGWQSVAVLGWIVTPVGVSIDLT